MNPTTEQNTQSNEAETLTHPNGKVYLIGAGPGDPELITLKGLRYLRMAETVLYDRLISPELLTEARADAELIYVGKGPGCHSIPQEQINRILIHEAKKGKIVVRLKGGDPYVFGRGGEEAEELATAGIPYEVVPGITSAIAVPAIAGIPVTHRAHSSTITIVTGHEGKAAAPTVNWDALAHLGGTLVVLMGVTALPHFTGQLIEYGMDSSMPAAVIQEGTTARQRIVVGTLSTIAQQVAEEGLHSPALTIIGTVVNVRATLIKQGISIDKNLEDMLH